MGRERLHRASAPRDDPTRSASRAALIMAFMEKHERSIIVTLLVGAAGLALATGASSLVTLFTVLAVLVVVLPVGGNVDRGDMSQVVEELRGLRSSIEANNDTVSSKADSNGVVERCGPWLMNGFFAFALMVLAAAFLSHSRRLRSRR